MGPVTAAFRERVGTNDVAPEVDINANPQIADSCANYGAWQPTPADRGWATVFGDASMGSALPKPMRRVGCAIVQTPWQEQRVLATRGEVLTRDRQ